MNDLNIIERERNQMLYGKQSLQDDIDHPVIRSPYTPFELPFYQTRETLIDIDSYSRFLKNAINRFRSSKFYKEYKSFLISLGLDRSQVHGNISNEMAEVEMHHNMLTVFDIAFIICEHVLYTRGYISTFDLVYLLKQEHRNNNIMLVMLDVTSHQVQQSSKEFFIHPSMCFGDWLEFLNKYKYGITRDIAFKIIDYLEKADKYKDTYDVGFFRLRNQIYDWSMSLD